VPDQVQLGFTALLTAEQRARQLLYAQPPPVPPLTRNEREVLRRICLHIGRKQPITRQRLEEATGLAEREVKSVVRDLIVNHGVAIGATRGKDHGYFLVDSAEDLEVAGRPLINEMRELARRLRVLYGPERVAELHGQLTLEEERSA